MVSGAITLCRKAMVAEGIREVSIM